MIKMNSIKMARKKRVQQGRPHSFERNVRCVLCASTFASSKHTFKKCNEAADELAKKGIVPINIFVGESMLSWFDILLTQIDGIGKRETRSRLSAISLENTSPSLKPYPPTCGCFPNSPF